MRFWRPLVVGAMLAAGLALGMASVSAHGSTRAARQLFVSPTGSDSNPCTQAAPCLTIARAYRAARPGETVLLRSGSYPAQLLGRQGSKTGPEVVTVQPEPGGRVSIEDLYVGGASYVTFRGLTIGDQIRVANDSPGAPGSTKVTFSAVRAKTFKLIGGISDITIAGSSFGDALDTQSQIMKNNPGDPEEARPKNVLIDGVTFHDFRRSDRTVHTECLQIIDGNTITIRNSVFYNCDGTGDLGLTFNNEPVVNLTIENNFFAGGGDTRFGVQISGNVKNLVFRYNSASVSVFFSDDEAGGPYTFVGNYMRSNYPLCERGGATFSRNVFRGPACGESDISVPTLSFVDESANDLHLTAGAAAIGRGDPSNHPRADLDGDMRPTGLAPDAGADQRESAALVPGRSIGAARIGEQQSEVVDFYDRPVASRAVKVGDRKLRRIAYRLHGGQLWVLLDEDVVVGVGTTSPFYETPRGIRATSSLEAVRAALRPTWTQCAGAYRRLYGGTAVYFGTARGKEGAKLVSIWMLKRSYPPCAT